MEARHTCFRSSYHLLWQMSFLVPLKLFQWHRQGLRFLIQSPRLQVRQERLASSAFLLLLRFRQHGLCLHGQVFEFLELTVSGFGHLVSSYSLKFDHVVYSINLIVLQAFQVGHLDDLACITECMLLHHGICLHELLQHQRGHTCLFEP